MRAFGIKLSGIGMTLSSTKSFRLTNILPVENISRPAISVCTDAMSASHPSFEAWLSLRACAELAHV